MADIYEGKVFGLFDPLTVREKPQAIVVAGGTFELTISRRSGQMVSAKVEGVEFIAGGGSLPNPYVGVFPSDEPGASTEGGKDRPRFGHELACEIYPKLFSGGLTAAHRYDAVGGPAEAVEIVLAEPDRAVVRSRGRYGDTPVSWEITYDVDVDGLTRVTVLTRTAEPVKLRWSCYNHATIAPEPVEFLIPWADVGLMNVAGFGPRPTRSTEGVKEGDLVLGAHLNPYFHLGNAHTGIEFSKEDFSDRWAGYRDSGTVLEDGRRVSFDTVVTEEGKELRPADSRGWRRHLTQVYRRQTGYEIEEFDIRNTTLPLNPEEPRARSFFFQLSPARRREERFNSCRVVWPGPHQIRMVRWSGTTEPWSPPSDEQVKFWAQLGVNLIVGGANYFSGDFSHPTAPDKIRRFLRTAHSYGMKVIPYVTFSDYNFSAPGYQEHAADWAASAAIEFKCETTLMCFGAEGWREHFEEEIDVLLGQFDFDGLYIDHWSNTRICNNARHGCGGYLLHFVVEGYHDIAKRARRVVARHTDGKGMLLLNSGDDVFSGVMSWFNMRLVGENIDPRRVPALTMKSSYDPERQGIHTLAYPSRFALDASFLNFVVSFMFSVRLQIPPKTLAQWTDRSPGDPWDGYKLYWDIWRFFDLNRAKLIAPFRSGKLARVKHSDGRVSLCLHEGRVLVVIGLVNLVNLEEQTDEIEAAAKEVASAIAKSGVSPGLGEDLARQLRPLMNPQGTAQAFNTVESAVRAGAGTATALQDCCFSDQLELLDLAALGLSDNRPYQVQDLLAHGYVQCEDIRRIPVTLHSTQPQVLLIEPKEEAPRLAHFTGADAAEVRVLRDDMTVKVLSVEGTPLALYVDTGSRQAHTTTTGFQAERLSGGLTRIVGAVPADKTVKVRFA